MISTGGAGGHIIPALILYKHLSSEFDLMIASDLRGLKYIDQNFELEDFLLVITISTISQIGDITVSYFKRLSKVKNTGKLIPGHGGILDRIDGMIFAFPFYYILRLIIF